MLGGNLGSLLYGDVSVMCTHTVCLSKDKKTIEIFHLKINILAAGKKHSLLHRRVSVFP